MPKFRTLDKAEVQGKRVLVRLDLNVPVDNGVVTDTTRIDRALPTLNELLGKGAAVLLLAHFDRPKGKVVPEMSLAQVKPALEKALGRAVRFISTDWKSAPNAAAKPGEVVLLENTRFHPGEEKNDAAFATLMAGEGDIYVNDAFSAAHRAHSSTEAIARVLPSYAGRAMEQELSALGTALETPKRPLVAVVGGAKVSTKLELLGNLTGIADTIIIGGGMANTFLAAQGVAVGKSLCEHDLADTARGILADAEKKGCTLLLPTDAVTAKEFKAGAAATVRVLSDIAADDMILDIGPASIEAVKAALTAANTVVWNGPLGAFEIAPFDKATVAAARHVAARTKAGHCVSVAGGGDTVAALNHAGAAADFTYISTAGGAFLEWLEGKPLPGVKALEH